MVFKPLTFLVMGCLYCLHVPLSTTEDCASDMAETANSHKAFVFLGHALRKPEKHSHRLSVNLCTMRFQSDQTCGQETNHASMVTSPQSSASCLEEPQRWLPMLIVKIQLVPGSHLYFMDVCSFSSDPNLFIILWLLLLVRLETQCLLWETFKELLNVKLIWTVSKLGIRVINMDSPLLTPLEIYNWCVFPDSWNGFVCKCGDLNLDHQTPFKIQIW